MDDAALYTRDPKRFAEAESDMGKAEEEWLDLEMLKEEVEG